ncbi:baseplate J/gp47 family protein [Clostridium sp. FP1]|uniref:baseplate J/gp47 family protein n=1 Tax=Clostridium sp. FP1 TaxID=2724076 RepID=UPI0013E973E7|nr:baseplate J/gp47 family protein [Clostridium sp. FP1]MBZ9637523.1 baseplate J/gp47 family protein [Clostridium sp. FP1]
MYENVTENEIKKRMLNEVPSDICKLEGSFIYDAISPVSMELANAYMMFDIFYQNVFAQTSSGEYLDKRANEFGVYRKEGAKARGKTYFTGADGVYDTNILIQTQNGLRFKTTEPLKVEFGRGTAQVEAAEIGKKYNVLSNQIIEFPMQINGISTVINITAVTGGGDIENDEELLKRLLTKVRHPCTSGNANHYKLWALETPGVGDVKVIPSVKEVGTIQLILIDNDKKAVAPQIVEEVKNHIEDERPIGVKVIVGSAVPKEIEIKVGVSLYGDHSLDDIKEVYKKSIEDFIHEITFKEDEIIYKKIGSLLISILGVKNYENLTINSLDRDIILMENEVAVLKGIELYCLPKEG